MASNSGIIRLKANTLESMRGKAPLNFVVKLAHISKTLMQDLQGSITSVREQGSQQTSLMILEK